MSKPRVIYWFRTDLRLHDSPALKAALDLQPSVLYPIWCWDPHYVYRARVGPNRWQFLIDCQNDLSKSITKLNRKSKLFLIREAPQTVLPKLFKAWKISHLVFEKDVDGYARERDREVMRMAEEAGVEVVVRSGRTLWDSDALVEKNGGRATMSIGQVQAAGKKVGEIARPNPAPTSLPDPGDTPLDFDAEVPPPSPDFNSIQRHEPDRSYSQLAGPNNDFAPPTLAELGIKPATTPHRGGETLGLAALEKIISNKEYTATFEKPKTAPTDFSPQSTTLLSPHMHFGSVSVREFYWRVQDVVSSYKGASSPPASLTGQLYFRDMYFGAQAALGFKFAQTHGNPTIRFVPWHLPSRIDPTTKLITGSYDVDSPAAETWFRRWKHGRTGFPWIDALMRQLRQEGWIHHLGRHAVACFLTRGGCYVDWERGAEVFEEWLIDHETACNVGNWQWLSCTAFFSQYYRCYSPIAFPQKTDKTGDFVRRYVPELRRYGPKYIYEPWKAPLADQRKWGCLVRGDRAADQGIRNLDEPVPAEEEEEEEDGMAVYPKPMLDFATRRDVCIAAMKKAYEVGLRGDDARVLDGSWRALFADDAEGPTHGETGPPGAMIGAVEDVEDAEEGAVAGETSIGGSMSTKKRGRAASDADAAGAGAGAGAGGSPEKKKKKKKGKRGRQGTMDAHVTKKV